MRQSERAEYARLAPTQEVAGGLIKGAALLACVALTIALAIYGALRLMLG